MYKQALSFLLFFVSIVVNGHSCANNTSDYSPYGHISTQIANQCHGKGIGKLTINIMDEKYKPIDGVMAHITIPAGDVTTLIYTDTDRDGNFEGKLCPGIYKGAFAPRLTKNGYFESRPAFTMKPNGSVSLGIRMEKIPLFSTKDLKYKGNHNTSEFNEGIKGTVTDLNGQPITGAYINITEGFSFGSNIPQVEGITFPINVITNSNGSFQQALPPGIYDIAVDKGHGSAVDNFYQAHRQLLIKPNVITTLDFTLEKYRVERVKDTPDSKPEYMEVEMSP